MLTKCFPQDRAGFLVGLASWGAACALGATVFRNAFGIAAAIAGSTAAIIASDELGAIGGPNGQAFVLATSDPLQRDLHRHRLRGHHTRGN